MHTFLQSPPGVSEAGGPLLSSSSSSIPASAQLGLAPASDEVLPVVEPSCIVESSRRRGLPGGPRFCEMLWAIEAVVAAECGERRAGETWEGKSGGGGLAACDSGNGYAGEAPRAVAVGNACVPGGDDGEKEKAVESARGFSGRGADILVRRGDRGEAWIASEARESN